MIASTLHIYRSFIAGAGALTIAVTWLLPAFCLDRKPLDQMLAAGQYKEAKKWLDRRVTIEPGNVPLLIELARVDEKLGDLDEAIKRARQATEAEPKNPLPHFLLAQFFNANRDDLAALTQYEVVLDSKEDQLLRIASFGPYLRLLVRSGKVKEAQKFSRKWVHENPKSYDCHFNRAWVLTQPDGTRVKDDEAAKVREEAISEYNEALQLKPKAVSTRFNLALLLIQNNHNKEALGQLKLFIEQAPAKDPDVATAQKLIAQLERQ